jgi:hypothetical protein
LSIPTGVARYTGILGQAQWPGILVQKSVGPMIKVEDATVNLLQIVILVSLLVLILWVAYKIGKVVLRILAGLAFFALAAYVVWYIFLRHRHPIPSVTFRSLHGSHLLFTVRR